MNRPLIQKPTLRGTCLVMLFVVASSLPSVHAAAARFDPDRLRSLIKFPDVKVEFKFQVTTASGVLFNGETLESLAAKAPADQIVEIRKGLRGDVTDADRYEKLATLYGRLSDEANNRSAQEKAADLLRQQVRSDPENGWLKCRLASMITNVDEAENLFRSATGCAANDWRCWRDLGQFLTGRASALVFTNSPPTATANEPSEFPSLRPATVDDRVNARRFLEEARNCFDRAISLAPTNAAPLLARAGFRSGTVVLNQALNPLEQPGDSFLGQMLSPEFLADLKEAARLSTDDPLVIAAAAFFEAFAATAGHPPEELLEKEFRSLMPDETAASVQAALLRLGTMGQRAETNLAGVALTIRGFLQGVILRDHPAAEDSLRRATQKNAGLDLAWEMLWGILGETDRRQECADLASQRLMQKDTARNHLFLAKALEKLHRAADAEKELLKALKHDPKDVLVNIALAGIVLKRAADDDELRRVGEAMKEFDQTLIRTAPPEQAVQFAFIHGIFFALVGNRAEAASHFRGLLAADPGNKDYQAAYEALGR